MKNNKAKAQASSQSIDLGLFLEKAANHSSVSNSIGLYKLIEIYQMCEWSHVKLAIIFGHRIRSSRLEEITNPRFSFTEEPKSYYCVTASLHVNGEKFDGNSVSVGPSQDDILYMVKITEDQNSHVMQSSQINYDPYDRMHYEARKGGMLFYSKKDARAFIDACKPKIEML